MLTGTNPYEIAGSIVQVMFAHCNGPPLDPREINKAIPPACSQVIARATAKLPENRYQHAGEMFADLEAIGATLAGAAITLPSQSGLHARLPATTLVESVPAVTSGRRKWLYPAIAAAAIGSGLLTALLLLIPGRNAPEEPLPSVAVPVAASAATIAPPTGEPIRVGVLHSLTGTMAESESPVVEATLLAIQELNEAGGVLGRPVEGLVRDGRSDPEVFASRAEALLTEDKVTTVFGCWTSASRKTVEPIFERLHGLLVYPVQYEGLEESPNVVYLGATPNQQIVPAVQWAYAFLGKRRFFLVGSDYVFPRAADAIIRDTLAEMNADVVGEEYLPLGSYDAKAIVDKIAGSQADIILNTINGSTNLPFFKELRAAGITPEQIPTISFSIGEQELRLLNVAEMTGDYAAWNYFQSHRFAGQPHFVQRFRAHYGPQRVLDRSRWKQPTSASSCGPRPSSRPDSRTTPGDSPGDARPEPAGAGRRVRIDPATRHAFKTPRIGQIDDDGQFEVVWKAVKPEAPFRFRVRAPKSSGRNSLTISTTAGVTIGVRRRNRTAFTHCYTPVGIANRAGCNQAAAAIQRAEHRAKPPAVTRSDGHLATSPHLAGYRPRADPAAIVLSAS